ncbi:MAG TPA: heme-degrading domain-containing protein [Burkholderiales bacterium]|nr:heme-degrading domain-containing protein [Burkholderiales bacterium]
MDDYVQLLDKLRRQEEELQFRRFDNDTALRIGLRLVELAKAANKAITVDIVRNGQQLFHCALAGTAPDNDEWARRKGNAVMRFGHSSYYMGTHYRARGTTFEEASRLDLNQYAAHGGAFPIVVKDVGLVGSVAVSGLPQAEDHELVVGVLREFVRSEPG